MKFTYKQTETRLPQEAVINPSLFNVYINERPCFLTVQLTQQVLLMTLCSGAMHQRIIFSVGMLILTLSGRDLISGVKVIK